MSGEPELKSIAGFDVIGELGKGGMGAVYRARHPRTGAEVAIKVILGHLHERTEIRERFRREVKAMALVEHPNLLRVLDAGEEEGNAFYVMQLVDGVDLASIVKRKGALAPQRVHQIARGTLSALQALHDAGIVHRDLKPHNVMLERTGRPVVMDLGLTRMADAETLTKTGALIGSPRYMPPELLTGKRSDERSDLYQIGLILWECATGETAVTGDDFQAVGARIMTGNIPPLLEKVPDFPPLLADVIHRCFALEPEHRFQSCQQAVDVLEGKLASDSPELAAQPAQPPAAKAPMPGQVAAPTGGMPSDFPIPPLAPPPAEPRAIWPKALAAATFCFLFAAGFSGILGRSLPPPEGLDLRAGVDRIAASWTGARGNRLQLVAVREDGTRYLVPRAGPAEVPANESGRSRLVLTDLDPDTDYQVHLRYEGGRSLDRNVHTVGTMVEDNGLRLTTDEDGKPLLRATLNLPARLELRYSRETGGTATVERESAETHRVPAPDLDLTRAGSGVYLKLTDRTGGVSTRRFALSGLLTAVGQDFARRVSRPDVEACLRGLERLHRKRSQDLEAKGLALVRELAAIAALREFYPLREGFFGPDDVPSELRIEVVNMLELLRRLDRCMLLTTRTRLAPSPSLALAGAYSMGTRPELAWKDAPLSVESKLLAGYTDPFLDHSRVKEYRAPFRSLASPAPPLARLSLHVPRRIDDSNYLRVRIPGGLKLLFFDDREAADPSSSKKKTLRRTIDSRDLPAVPGGDVVITYHDLYGNLVGGETRISWVHLGGATP